MSETTSAVIVTTTLVAFVTGFGLGVYAVRGSLVPPELAAQRAANLRDPVESDESDVDEHESLLDHAPNWANGPDADRRQGLSAAGAGGVGAGVGGGGGAGGGVRYDGQEECKMVLVVRTDLGMTKGECVCV